MAPTTQTTNDRLKRTTLRLARRAKQAAVAAARRELRRGKRKQGR